MKTSPLGSNWSEGVKDDVRRILIPDLTLDPECTAYTALGFSAVMSL